jgi:putative transposase
MTTLDLKIGDIFDLPDGRFRFHEEWDDETLWFLKEKTGKRLPLSETELVEMLGEGMARKVDIFRRSDGLPKAANELGDFGPDEEFSPEATRARTFQFYVRQWDDTPGVSAGRVGLQAFIDGIRTDALKKGLTHVVRPDSLYSAIVNCGEPGKRPLSAFRSRRGKSPRARFDRVIESAITVAVDFYWSLRSRTYTDAFAYFRGLIKVENEKREAEGKKRLPTPRRMETLRRRINLVMNQENWSRKYSPREAHLKFEGIKDSLGATRPLELVIMDHTPLDTWVVFDNEQFLPLGRPYLTIAIDVATRMVLGYLISFEPPSLHSMLTTLKRVNRNKNYMKYVFPKVDGVWDGWGRPESILVDSGWEMKSPSLQDALRDLGTEIIWSPVRTPQYKAIGERFFKTMNDRIFHKLPGAVPAGPSEMRLIDVKPREEATLSLGHLDELMHEAIIGYHMDFHSTLGDLPQEVWKRTLKTRHIISDIKALDHLLGRTAKVRLTRRGVRFKNMTFHDQKKTSQLLDELVADAKRRDQPKSPIGSGRAWVKIKWDPIDASCIQVWNDAAKPPRFVTLQNHDSKFVLGPPWEGSQRDSRREFTRPISFWHAEKVGIFAREKNLPFKTDEQRWVARDKLRAKWEKIAGLLPLRDTREAIRGLAQTQGMFDRPHPEQAEAMKASDVLFATADSSPSGMGAATLVPDQVAAFEREGEDRHAPKGRGPTEKAKAKGRRTRREKDDAAAEKRTEEATEKAKQRARSAAEKKAASAEKTVKPGEQDLNDDDYLDEK